MTAFFIVLGILVVSFVAIFVIIGYHLSVPGYQGPPSTHFDGAKFHNPSGEKAKGFMDVMKFFREREAGTWTIKEYTPVRDVPLPEPDEERMHLTFINHSSFLIQLDGINMLTDPIWSERCSPFQWTGPKRLRPPGINFEDLPPIDLVLLTHNHYDHLDLPTIRRLERDHNPRYIVPLGVSRFLKKNAITDITELDWWDRHAIGDLEIRAIPANHFSGRGMFDRDKTLWCGYLIEVNGHRIYFVGDTGYSNLFEEIGEEIDPVDLACIPIGAYKPRWFMSPIHVSPAEAVRIHRDINAAQSVAMHFGCFPLANDGNGAAESDLKAALAEHDISEDEFIIPEEGMTYTFGG